MYSKLSTRGMSNDEWLSLRKSGIGGSDAGAICGVNPYSSSVKVFIDKTSDKVSEINNEAVRIGHDLEQYVADRFTEATGLKTRKSNFMYRSTQYPFMIADVDHFIVGENAGLECKTVSAYNADKWADGKIPPHYKMQCYHYMAVTGRKTWYIAAVILGRDFVYHKLSWDDEIISALIDAEETFWNSYVLTKTMPPPDGSSFYDEAITECFPNAAKEKSVKLIGFDEKLHYRKEILDQIAELQEKQKVIEQEIKLYMRDSTRAYSDDFTVSWSNVSSARLDAKRIKDEKPEIYAQYSKITNGRRFEIKEANRNGQEFYQTA